MTAQEKRQLDIKLAMHFYPIKKIFYNEWDTERLNPLYIPSGKPWRTHQIDARPIPRFTESLDACTKILLPKLAEMPNLHVINYQFTGHSPEIELLRHGWLIVLANDEGDYAANDIEPALAFCLTVEQLIDSHDVNNTK